MRRRMLASLGGAKLPYKRRLAYLESTGVEYINTLITPSNDLTVRCVYYSPQGGASSYIYGCRVGGSTISVAHSPTDATGGGYARWGANGYVACAGYGNHGVIQKYRTIIVDGDEYKYSPLQSVLENENINIALFGCTTTESGDVAASRALVRIFSFQIDKGEDNVIDYIPVIDLHDRPCMYNQAPIKVADSDPSRFFYNQGDGEFLYGELE